jgi:hypothetical protein
MALITFHDTNDGIRRLLNSMLDIEQYPYHDASYIKLENAVESQRVLFESYVQLIRQACADAETWWAGTIEAQRANGLNESEAIAKAFDDRMAGPASDPKVVWIVRLIWLECMKRNRDLQRDQQIRPEFMLLQWLIDAGETELVRLIACMPYWPIGLDENGNWC